MLTPIIIAYLLLALAVMLFQRWLVFIPTRIPANVIPQVAAEHGFQPWTNTAGLVIGWKIPARDASRGSVLIVHGNAGCAVSRDYIAQPIHYAESVDVYVLEYPGYGAREGSPSKQSLDAAAEEAFQLLPADQPRYVVSESLGAGVAGENVDALSVDGGHQVVELVGRGDLAGEQVVDLTVGEVALLFAGVDQFFQVVFVLVDFFSHGCAHSCVEFCGPAEGIRRSNPLVVS